MDTLPWFLSVTTKGKYIFDDFIRSNLLSKVSASLFHGFFVILPESGNTVIRRNKTPFWTKSTARGVLFRRITVHGNT